MSIAIADATADGVWYHVPLRAIPAISNARRDRLPIVDVPGPRGVVLVEEDARSIHVLTWEVVVNAIRLSSAMLKRFKDERGARIVGSYTRQIRAPQDGDEYYSESAAFRLFAAMWAIIPEANQRSASTHSGPPTVARVSTTQDGPSIIYLQRPTAHRADEGEATGRKATHRWTVSGHWRNQPYPTRGTTERIWIETHTAGADDLDTVHRDRVYVVAPTTTPA